MATVDVVRACLAADQPVLLWGAPGTGKTAALLALGESCQAHVEVLIGSTLDPTDVGGYLVPTGGHVVSHPPPWATRLAARLERKAPAWLMLDELSCAPPSVQAALLRVIHERRVGELDLTGTRVVAAGNPADSAADGGSLSAASANRWAHIQWSVDATEWVAGELSGWGHGHDSPRLAAARADVAGFIMRNPSALSPAVPTEDPRAYPSPRAWSAVARVVSECTGAVRIEAAGALVGKAAAAEYAQFVATQDLPDPEMVLSGTAKLPTRADALSATLMAVVAAASVSHESQSSRVLSAWEVLSRVRPDRAILPARVLLDIVPSVPPVARALGAEILRVRDGMAKK